MTTRYKLINDGARDVVFDGEELAEASSRSASGSRQNRWTELRLFRSEGGTLILKIVGRTLWQGESDRHEVVLCGTSGEGGEEAVVTALMAGNGGRLSDLAKDLLEASGIEATMEVA
jgi:hypothetical protein